MKNNLGVLQDIDNSAFLNKIKLHLGANLSNKLIIPLSNILTIDYVTRLKKEPELDDYSTKCVDRLKNHLKHMIFTDEDFSGVLTLFAIAITNEKKADEELINTQVQNQDVIIDAITASQFPDLSPAEQLSIKEVLKSLVAGHGEKEIINFVASNPKLFYSIVLNAYKEKTKQKEIMENVNINLNRVITNTKSINKKKNKIKLLTGKIAMAAGLVAAASIGTFLGGLALPAIIIPAVAVSIKLGTVVGEKTGELVAQNNRFVKTKQSIIKDFAMSIEQPSLDQNISKYMKQKQDISLNPELTNIKPSISSILDKNLVKTKQKEKGRHR